MIDLRQETDAWTSLPTRDRLRALQPIIPRVQVEEVLAETSQDQAVCKRLPGWFMIALGLCCRDSYRQIFRWLQPFRLLKDSLIVRGVTPRIHYAILR